MISSRYITASFQLLFFITITHFLIAQETENQHQVWMTYYKGRDLQQDFKDMKAHGVDAIEVGIWGIQGNSRAKNVLIAARQNNLKLIIGIPEVAEQAFKFENENPERAVMMGGAYKGKAIDRFRFPFTPKEHSITIESPVYDSTNCYGDIGRYFMGLTPVKAEVVIKQADFDGQQHLQIIDAQIKSQKEHSWNMQFDLTGVKGDLDNVVLAVYWISKGTRDYWIFGDAVSMFSDGFKQQLKQEVKSVVNDWKAANNGVFPPEIIAVRYGDECFHISGHLNSDACSYPMWDFSESAIRHFRNASKMEYPRGVGWTDMFGHESYAKWMYNFHEAAAQSVKIVKETLLKEGIENLPVFRNTTRMNAFDVMNDWDGSGQELLSRQLDILHIDPYPVNANGYDKDIIPRDMSYIEGFSKRFDKPIVPWMQAHVYGHLKHPTPQHISRMMEQQLQFNIQNIMWLGYGYNNSGNTFPSNNAESWKQAKKEHSGFKNATIQKNKAEFAVIRPYTARSMRGKNRISADEFLTDYLVEKALFNFNLHYDVFEPLSCNELKPEELKSYSFIVAEIGVLNEKTLQPFILSKVPTILIIAGAEIEKSILEQCGIEEIGTLNSNPKGNVAILKNDSLIKLEKQIETLLSIEGAPLIWKKNELIFIANIHEKNVSNILKIVSNTMERNKTN